MLRFRNEARSAARLDHPNIARVFYVGEDRGLHFIAFEFVTGRTVRDLLPAGRCRSRRRSRSSVRWPKPCTTAPPRASSTGT